MSWRDLVDVHPAAGMFPMLGQAELRELAHDIKEHGLRHRVVVDTDGLLLDGRNRLDAMEMVGIETIRDGKLLAHIYEEAPAAVDPEVLVVGFNLRRRHLTGEQRAEVIRRLKASRPEMSTRTLAEQVGVSHTTIHRAIAPVAPIALPAVTDVTAGRAAEPRKGKSPIRCVIDYTAVPAAGSSTVKGRDGKSYPATKRTRRSPEELFRAKMAREERVRAEERAQVIIGFSLLLHSELDETLDALTRILADERKRIAEMPMAKRVVLARGYLHALGVTLDDLRPVT
jgi:hypothetical protein